MTGYAEFIGQRHSDAVLHESLLDRYRGASRAEPSAVVLEDLADDNAMRHKMAGYQAGAMFLAAQEAESLTVRIAEEKLKIERGESAARRLMDLHGQGRIDALQVAGMQSEDSGDPALLQQLQDRLDRIRRSAGQASRAASAAAGMVSRMGAGTGWEAQRAERAQAAETERLLARKAENDAWMHQFRVRHHEAELARAQVRERDAERRDREAERRAEIEFHEAQLAAATELERAGYTVTTPEHWRQSGTGWPAVA